MGVLVVCGSEAPAGPDVRADDVWSRPVVAMGEMSGGSDEGGMGHAKSGTGAVFMKLVNKGRVADRLTGGKTDVAEVVEIHETKMEGDVMKMHHLPDGLEIPAQAEVILTPGGYHLMLIGVTRDLNIGDEFQLSLEFEKSEMMTVEVVVREP
jgi:copper(I)-binding protein